MIIFWTGALRGMAKSLVEMDIQKIFLDVGTSFFNGERGMWHGGK